MSITRPFLQNPGLLKDVQILVVDNDRDSRDLYTCLFESYGAKVTTLGLVEQALDFLDRNIPDICICEIRFLGESVYPLMQQIRHLALKNVREIAILATSTCSLSSFMQQCPAKVDAYLLKPIDLDSFVDQVWQLIHLPSLAYLPGVLEGGDRNFKFCVPFLGPQNPKKLVSVDRKWGFWERSALPKTLKT